MPLTSLDLKWYQSSQPLSAGGTITDVLIPNQNATSGLFPQVPRQALEEGRVDYRKVFLKNDNAEAIPLSSAGVFLLFQPTAGEVIGIALGTADDTDGSNLAYTAPDVKERAIPIGSLAPGASQGIWIRRQVEAGQNPFVTSTFQLAAFGYGPTP
jgi:hypothetical protein